MSFSFRPSANARMGIRASVAVCLTLMVSAVFHLERAYWGTLVSVALVGETWGQSLQRAAERLIMTVLGGLAGWALHWALGQGMTGRATMLFGCVFLAVYFRSLSYRWMIFFVTVYVVFLFALLGAFTPHLVFVRVYETAIGCLAALAAALLVRPARASEQLGQLVQKLWEKCELQAQAAFDSALGKPISSRDLARKRLELYHCLLHLHQNRGLSMYESLNPGRTLRHWNTIIDSTRAMFQSVIALEETLESLGTAERMDRKGTGAPASLSATTAGAGDSGRREGELAALAALASVTRESFVDGSGGRSAVRLPVVSSASAHLLLVQDCVLDIRRACRRLGRQRGKLIRPPGIRRG